MLDISAFGFVLELLPGDKLLLMPLVVLLDVVPVVGVGMTTGVTRSIRVCFPVGICDAIRRTACHGLSPILICLNSFLDIT
jgi:hypothetical protein